MTDPDKPRCDGATSEEVAARLHPNDRASCWKRLPGGYGTALCGGLSCNQVTRCGKPSEHDGYPFCWIDPSTKLAYWCYGAGCVLTRPSGVTP